MKHEKYTEEEIALFLNKNLAYEDKTEELYEADADCNHVIKNSCGGGVECMRCGGWFCY